MWSGSDHDNVGGVRSLGVDRAQQVRRLDVDCVTNERL